MKRSHDAIQMDEQVYRKCDGVMKMIMKRQQAIHFAKPVDWKRMSLHDYPRLIKQPMDLGTAGEKLARNSYGRLEEFANDIRLVWVRTLPTAPHALLASTGTERGKSTLAEKCLHFQRSRLAVFQGGETAERSIREEGGGD